MRKGKIEDDKSPQMDGTTITEANNTCLGDTTLTGCQQQTITKSNECADKKRFESKLSDWCKNNTSSKANEIKEILSRFFKDFRNIYPDNYEDEMFQCLNEAVQYTYSIQNLYAMFSGGTKATYVDVKDLESQLALRISPEADCVDPNCLTKWLLDKVSIKAF